MSLISPKTVVAFCATHGREVRDIEINDAELVKKYGLATGSRVFGGCTENSDYDYVLTADGVQDLLQFPWGSLAGEYAGLFTSSRLHDSEGRDINLIIVPEQVDFNAWSYATECMLNIPLTGEELNRDQRTKIFGYFLLAHYKRYGNEDQIKQAEETWG